MMPVSRRVDPSLHTQWVRPKARGAGMSSGTLTILVATAFILMTAGIGLLADRSASNEPAAIGLRGAAP